LIDALENSIQDTIQNPSNITVITDMLDYVSRSVYMSKSVLDDFTTEYKGAKGGVAHHLGRALIEYKISHPKEKSTTIIQQRMDEKIDTVQDRLEQKILCKDISRLIGILDNMKGKTGGDKEEFQTELISHLKKAIKIKNPNEKLIKLMELIDNDGYLQ